MRSTHFWRLIPGAALILLSAGSSLALTLGRAQGVAVLGRPLDVTVPVVLDNAGDDVCARADVYYGETRVEARSVELRPQAGQNAVMRVQVNRPVDEAFITVQMQVGCMQTLSRRFVLLSENPIETAEAAVHPTPAAPTVMPVPSSLPLQSQFQSQSQSQSGDAVNGALYAGTPAAISANGQTSGATTQDAAASAAAPRSRPTRPAAAPVPPAARRAEAAPKPAPRPAASAPVSPKAPVAERPRLKLDTVDLATPVGGALKSSNSLQAAVPAVPATSATPATPATPAALQRAEAAAQWQALNAQPEDILRSTERMNSLEADVRAMREGMSKNQAMLTQLNARLQQAESERYANGLVYALAALLAGVTGLAGWLWIRSRRAAAAHASWWNDAPDSSEPVLHEEPPVAMPQAVAATVATPAVLSVAAPDPAAPPAARDASATVAEPMPVASPPSPLVEAEADSAPTAEEMQSLLASTAASLPMADTNTALDELKDVAQQAEFFVSLGEYERAIAVLRGQIDAHPQSSALPWLELLALYQQLQRQDEYERVRRDFEWLFNHTLPATGVTGGGVLSLEAGFPEVFAAVQAAWGRRDAIDRIEDHLLRRPGRESLHLIDLAALRELLMLHGVALDHLAAGGAPLPMPGTAAHASSVQRPPVAELAGATAGAGASSFGELSLDAHPDEGWIKLARPAGLDVNLDDLDHPPSVGADKSAEERAQSMAVPDANLLDFDLDTGEQFKLPKRS